MGAKANAARGICVFRTVTSIAVFTMLSTIAHAHGSIVSTTVAKAMAAQPNRTRGSELYEKRCKSCHGIKGWGDGLEDVPSLAGQRELYLVTQLAQFAAQERSGSTMHKATSTADVNNPQALRNLAAFLSLAPPNPEPEHAEDAVPASGASLFQRNCAACHGAAAQGSSTDPIPALAGQHYDYLLIQLKTFARGHRGRINAPVIDFAAGLSDDEQRSIADYLSRLKPTAPTTHMGAIAMDSRL
jgi:cytochrome c553